ncbi:MAG: hypothetical protein AAFZ01_10470 [Pseudomonadota bacterium]
MQYEDPPTSASPNATKPQTRVKLMAATPREFATGMGRLLRNMPHTKAADVTTVELPGGHVTVTYAPREGRRLSPLVVMPAADVTFVFDSVSLQEQDAFIARFDKVFQRGGG